MNSLRNGTPLFRSTTGLMTREPCVLIVSQILFASAGTTVFLSPVAAQDRGADARAAEESIFAIRICFNKGGLS